MDIDLNPFIVATIKALVIKAGEKLHAYLKKPL